MKTKILLSCVILAVFCLPNCGANIYTTEQEVNFGNEFAVEIEKQSNILEDQELTGYINDIGQRIATHCDRPEIEYHFKIIDDDSTVNAFAIPGGFIYIYSGLLLKADNEAEIAGVIAHEVGHVVAKHSMKRMTQLVGYQFLLGVALGQNPNQLAQLGADFLAAGLILNYGRDNEFEADSYGVKYSHAIGYDPEGYKTFLEKLSTMHHSPEEKGLLDKMMATHPEPDDRIARVESYISVLPENEKILNEDRFLKMRSRLEK